MRVTVPDTVLDAYQAVADRQGRSLEAVVTDQLQRFAQLPPGEPAVVLGGDDLARVEEYLHATLTDGAHLARRVSQLAGISFHRVVLDFTPGQLAELAHRADRQGKPVKQLAEEIIREISTQFFWATGGGPAAERVPSRPAASG